MPDKSLFSTAGFQAVVAKTGQAVRALISDIAAHMTIVPDQLGVNLRVDPTWPYFKDWTAVSSRPQGTLFFTFIEVDEITESAAVNYSETEIIGRAESFLTYQGTANREITLPLGFRAQGRGGVDLKTSIEHEVMQPARWLDSLKYPFIDIQGISHAPPPLILTIGELLTMRCVLSAADIVWLAPFDPGSHLPLAATVAATFRATHRSLGNYEYSGPARFTGRDPSLVYPQ